MYILGISALYHESATALIKDGEVVAAIEESRFSRVKHDNQFPLRAIEWCLAKEKITASDLTAVAYYEKPLLKFERILTMFVRTYPFALVPFLKGIPEWLSYKIQVEKIIRKNLGFKKEIFFIPHHLSHAASAYFPSPFTNAAVFTVDGVGEYDTTALWDAQENNIAQLRSLSFPHSLGLLYATFTSFLGFAVNDGEYKVMGLAAYGKPTFTKKIKQIVALGNDGSFELDMRYFGFEKSFRMWSREFEKLFGSPRKQGEEFRQRHKDIAASLQLVTEEIYFNSLRYLHRLTGKSDLCIGGGVALNALANGKIYKETPFKRVFVFGAAGDSGSAAGSALFVYHSLFGKKDRHPVKSLLLGTSYSDKEIETLLKKYPEVLYKRYQEEKLIEKVSGLLAEGKIVGWFDGRGEFGPRALGARSILARPGPRIMKDRINRVKRREFFRPFAGSVLQEYVHEYFDVPEKNHWSPFMTFCFPVKPKKKEALSAITHEDGTCRVQTVSSQNRRYEKLIRRFYEKTGIACILNTSFNHGGEPIVENPQQAVRDLLLLGIDYLVLGNFLVFPK